MKLDRRIASSSLSSRIIGYLLEQGHSQVDIAQMLGVSQGFISLVKSKERGLTLDHLERLAESISVPLGEFMLAATEPAKGAKYPKELFKNSAKVIRMADKLHEAIMQGGTAAAKGRPKRAASR
jgi:transcriptional regulator with XRE-family HTH domain